MVDGFDAALAAAGVRPVTARWSSAGCRRHPAGARGRRRGRAGPVHRAGDPRPRKRLFEGFDRDVDLEIRAVHHSRYAVHVRYAVSRRASDTD
ncbi:hypothetical protein V2I01_36130 [Micromonospora sp. BRA006-A]|nr:hypothetical protein [Micromonospora sp. BRA006-A]